MVLEVGRKDPGLAAKSLETLVPRGDMENRKCSYEAGWAG